jgi:hypothetical protein
MVRQLMLRKVVICPIVSTVKRINKEKVPVNTMAATQLSGIRSLFLAPGCYRLDGKTTSANLLTRKRENQRGFSWHQLNFILVTEQIM